MIVVFGRYAEAERKGRLRETIMLDDWNRAVKAWRVYTEVEDENLQEFGEYITALTNLGKMNWQYGSPGMVAVGH